MKKNLVGVLIGEGKTTAQIQERIKDFPTNPTVEDLIQIGYKRSTARNYINQLRRNNLINSENDEGISENGITQGFIYSQNADKNNLILDTCALQHREVIKIIEESPKVTVLDSTLIEMDKLKRRSYDLSNREIFLQTMIQIYGRKFLEEEKYRLVPFVGDEYNDNSIIEYIMQQPINERPTIITADTLFACRAKCLGLNYIFYHREKISEKENLNLTKNREYSSKREPNKSKEKAKKVREKNSQLKNGVEENQKALYELGVRTCLDEEVKIKKFNYQAAIYIVKDNECISIKENEIELNKNDVEYISIVAKVSKHGCVKVVKEMVRENGLAMMLEREYTTINEIYQDEGELHEDILKCCKVFLEELF